MSIDDKLKKYISSNEGKNNIKQSKQEALSKGKSFGQRGGQVISEYEANKLAEELRAMLIATFHDSSDGVNLESIEEQDIVIQPMKYDKNLDKVVVDFYFDKKAVFRPSLAPDRFKEGVPNIIVHLTHGWDAKGTIRGTWYSKRGEFKDTLSRKHFSGDNFMERVVKQFNSKNKVAEAELHEKYIK